MIKNMRVALAEIGAIKIGGLGEEREGKSGKYRLPVKFDHIEIVSKVRDAQGFYLPDPIMAKLGEKPMELDIVLLYDSVDLNFQTCYALYEGKKCRCRGDGEQAERHLKDGGTEMVICNESCEFLKKKLCKVSGCLSCLLPMSELVGGVYKFRTHGWNSVSNILGSLCFIYSMTGGKLSGIPLRLVLREKLAEYEEKGQQKTTKMWSFNVEFKGNIQTLRQVSRSEAQERLQIGLDMKSVEEQIRNIVKAETDDEAEEIQQEFYPDKELQQQAERERRTVGPTVTMEKTESIEEIAPGQTEIGGKV